MLWWYFFLHFDYQKCINLSVLRFSWGHRVNVLLCYWLGVSPHIFRKSTIFFLHIGVFFINKWLINCYLCWLLDGCIFRKRNAPTLVFPLSRTFFICCFVIWWFWMLFFYCLDLIFARVEVCRWVQSAFEDVGLPRGGLFYVNGLILICLL